MSYRMSVAVVSLGSISLGLLAASITVHAVGCGQSAEELFTPPGKCVASPSDTIPKCACSAATDCPAATECMGWRCESHECKADLTTALLPVDKQIAGDCKRVECSEGKRKLAIDDNDVPASQDACRSATCMDGEPQQTLKATGTSCVEGQVGVCNGQGGCVRCLENTNQGCGTNEVCHTLNGGEPQCVPEHCLNGTKDGDETDMNCGGSCKPCLLGDGCSKDSDCSNHTCAHGIGPDEKVCCQLPCTAICKVCSKGTGKCDDAPTGTIDSACAMGQVCAKGAACVFQAWHSCAKNGECMSGHCDNYTNGNLCSPGSQNTPCILASDCKIGPCDAALRTCQQ
jgi:hypothetical protein